MYQRPRPFSPRAIDKPYRFLKLPLQVDSEPLVAELREAGITWAASQWKWHLETLFCVLRAGGSEPYPGGALMTGAGVDRPVLGRLPRLRAFLDGFFPAPARVAWLGLSPPGARIFLHRDNTHHWDEHHRVHIPLVTSPAARLCVAGRFLHMPAGSAWAFNNTMPHGALNTGPDRIHLMVDLLPGPAVQALFAGGEPATGEPDPDALARLKQDPFTALEPAQRADHDLMQRLRMQ